jgi:hypothetical protein
VDADVADVANTSESDRKFILAVIDKISAWTGTVPPEPVIRNLSEAPAAILRSGGGQP